MYEAIFQTTDRPFRATPDERFYFPYDSVEQARQTLSRVVRRAEGPAMVMGGSGLGKTMLAQVVAEDLSDLFDVIKLHATRLCSRRALLQSILFELQLPYRDLSEGELRLSLMNRMERSPEYAPSGLLLIVDEAHTLPIKLLEELRLITNFSRSGEPRARLILVGSLALEDMFARPQLESFNQRLAARCYLQPMNRQQTQSFIAHQLRCIGAEPTDVITRDAMDAVYAASEGIPRLTNQVMDHALVLAITNGQSPISAALVEEAWSDLQQLPAPWHGSSETSSAAPIEFGSLEDDDLADEIAHEVELSLPAETKVERLPTTMPKYEFEDLGFEPVNSTPIEAASGTSSTPESDANRASYSFFDKFQDVGEEPAELPQFVFTQVEELPPTPVGTPPQPSLGPTDSAANSALEMEPVSESNEFGMLVIHEDPRSEFFPLGQIDGFIASHWDYSQAVWSPTRNSGAADTVVTVESDLQTQSLPETIPHPMPVLHSDPFGEDFDEEFAIETPSQGIWAGQQKLASIKPAAPAIEIPKSTSPLMESREQDALDQISQMQKSLDGIQLEIHAQPEIAIHGMDFSLPVAAGHEHVWQVDTASPPTPSEEVLHEEIEDLISQLNFSAFSIEPENIEQISIDYMRVAAPAPIQVFERAQVDNDPPIYSMHEPAPQESLNCFDDDRELLVVEEDIPLSMRLSSVPTAPTRTEVQSYNQLFTKLRN